MPRDQFNNVCNSLLQAANNISPTGVEQRGFVHAMQELQKEYPDELDEGEIYKRFVGYMLDGLAYGNWPQTKF